ncbi:MAG: glycyl radical protein [Nanoarchaeota archaeon]|nr:glycyl radical protein [Nanoarchaeota archaeon]MBU1321546.1 glycyl radical protein [Nanoarchaeota archaeon]MBU1596854.1 glycyl radical protein [Nanoarchaeota archaeon]MBU2441198.1 glycyl radical protein [Nanoarchaeota archaeon]
MVKTNLRIKELREQSINAHPYIDSERARLITEFYENNDSKTISEPVKRALAFQYLLNNKTICINNNEVIVGERGSAPKATPTYPEITVHTLEDLVILDTREKISFKVNEKTKEFYHEKVGPYWKDKSIRDKIFIEMSEDWINAYEAGIFTEFMEQRAPGHTVLGDKIYKQGLWDIQKEIDASLQKLDFFNDPEAYKKKEELTAMHVAASSLIEYARRHSEKALRLAKIEKNKDRKSELEEIARICTQVPARTPKSFHEALQYYWFVHLGVITELNTWDSFNPGRLDQHLYPFYKQGLKDGTLTEESAKELLQSFWVKFNNQPAPPKVGVTAEESGTYTDFCLINLGGVKQDGSDAVNELSYLLLDVIEEMRILQPSSMVQISKKNPEQFLKRALKIVKTGFGQPSIFNTDVIVQELIRQGKSIEDARNGGASGCVETGAFGKEAYILTGYFNMPKVLEIALNNGVDPRTGKQIGLETGDPKCFHEFDDLLSAYEKQIKHFVDIKIKGSNIIERLYAEHLPTPFMSLLIDDCIKNGKDYHDGGARYNTNYIQGVGVGTITDTLTSIKHNVFDNKNISLDELLDVLKNDFKDKEDIRQMFWNKTPKYGNDDDYADDIMKSVFEIYFNAIDGRPNTKGGHYRINLLPTTCHVYFGKVTGATADGRKAEEPLSEGVSPVQGADRKGPTAVLKSVAKMDHARTGGTLLNQKFTPQILEDETGLDKVANLVRSYFAMDGHHIQFNVVDADTLLKAQKEPDKYRDLIVRVAGYSDYFVDLSPALQNEIIQRTEHKE